MGTKRDFALFKPLQPLRAWTNQWNLVYPSGAVLVCPIDAHIRTMAQRKDSRSPGSCFNLVVTVESKCGGATASDPGILTVSPIIEWLLIREPSGVRLRKASDCFVDNFAGSIS